MKTTKKDFELFKKYSQEYAEILGLSDWAIFYEHAKTRDSAYAETLWDVESHTARIILGTSWDNIRYKTDIEIKRLALHETIHVLISPLTMEAMSRYTTGERIATEEHRIVRMLEKLV